MASKLEKLNLTHDELDRFKKAMEDPTFRDLLREYTDEISNPANRAEHEAYLREVEARAAHDPAAMQEGDYSGVHGIQIPKGCKLISPTPVMCIKVVIPSDTSRTVEKKTIKSSKAEKFFINMCICDAMDDVSSQKVNGEGPKAGQQFSLPYSMTGPRETKDTKGEEAKVYDFIFSEATWKQYAMQMRVVVMFQEMAVEALEERESIRNGTLDKSAVIVLKNTTFKGGKPPPRVFKMSEEKVKQQKETSAAATKTPASTKAGEAAKKPAPKIEEVSSEEAEKPKETRQTPKHTLVHRGYYEMSQEQLILEGERTLLSELAQSRPKELVVKIELPLVQKISEVNLDQSVNQILLTSAQYFLLLPLPYPVVEENCSASWSGKTKTLTITCKVGAISDSELEKYKAQRANYDGMVEKKAALATAEAQAEAEAEAAAAKEAKQAQDRLLKEQQLALEAKKAQEEAEAEAAAEKQRRIDIEAQLAAANKPTSPNPALPSALKHSPHSSPRLDADGNARHVRFSFSQPQAESGIPERDGPLGPKPVGKLVEEIVIPPVHKGKGHKKKHVPGAEGPEAWTGIGKEPSKEIMEHFPADQVPMLESPTNQGKKGANKSPSLNSANSPTNGNAAARLWPAYSYSQSKVSVVLVIKIKSISNDSVKLVVDDMIHSASGEKRSSIDLYFSTTSPKKHYRLFLPLAYPVVNSKCNFQVSAQNIILNLLKVPTSPSSESSADSNTEWDHLLDYSLLGDFDAEGTPLNSPQVSSSKSSAAVAQMMDELSLGISAQNHALIEEMQEQENGNQKVEEAAIAEPVPVVTMQPIAVDASAMLNPFVAAASAALPSAASKAPPTKAVPSNSLLFQLD